MERYHVLDLIGEGSFGKVRVGFRDTTTCDQSADDHSVRLRQVYKGRRVGTAEIVALKFIPKRGRTPKV